MRFSVLKAGTATRQSRERIGDVDRMFIDLLEQPGDRWDVHDVEHGAFPEHVSEYDGFVITGGRASAMDKENWVLRLHDTVREAHQRGALLLGICLGHQVVAAALGGEVGQNPSGWDIGIVPIELTAEGRALENLRGAPRPLRILQSHRDVVTRLPPEAVHLAESQSTRYEMFRLGDTVLGLQGHPELDAEEVREIISRRRELLGEKVADRGMASLSLEPHRTFLQQFLHGFLRGEGLRSAGLNQSAG